MKLPRHVNDSVHLYMGELTSRIVAESGIPSDRFHLGKLILQSLRDDPNTILHIDAATEESETFGEGLTRTVKCATVFRNLGLKIGDVIVVMAPNHIDLAIPVFAALYVGVAVAPIDMTLKINELRDFFKISKPRMIFCQNEKVTDVQQALDLEKLDANVVTFDGDNTNTANNVCSFSKLLEKYEENEPIEKFRATDFDPAETLGFLISTSGTTGTPKLAAATQKNLVITGPCTWIRYVEFPKPTRMTMVVAPLQWLTAINNYLVATYMKYPRLQSSKPVTQEHAFEMINKYKPTYLITSPTMLSAFLNSNREKCDLTCLDLIMVAGSAVHNNLIDEIQNLIPDADVVNIYGMTESTTTVFQGHRPPPGSSGKQIGSFQYRLIDLETGKDIIEPNKPGELWLKGPGMVKGYYNQPEATKEAFSEDGWFKTGDMMYRDQEWYYYFVERIKLLLKYKSYQISPVELEHVIRQHPGVMDVAVTGIPDEVDGDLPVACVIPRPGIPVTAQEIKDLVKDSLADSKQLRGGVIFMKEFPLTATTKLHRRLLRDMVLTMKRE